MPVTTTNPATGQALAEYRRTTPAEVDAALDASAAAFGRWRHAAPSERAELLSRLADAIEADADRAAGLITAEMGKPVTQARGEVAKCADLCRHYAGRAERLLAPELVETEARASYVRLDPLGPVLGVMPWNFPFWQVFRWGVPTLLAGNTLLLKHADNVLGAAAHVAELFETAGAPAGLFASLCLANDDVAAVVEDRRVRGASLTGSVRAGRSVAAAAGRSLKPSVLELGGSDAALILPDADLGGRMADIAFGRFQNTGQTCIATKRYLVHESIADDFTERLVETARGYRVDDPTDASTELGPMARPDLRDGLNDQLKKCVADGLEVRLAGGPREGAGNWFDPVVLFAAKPGDTPFREELFGPVATVCVCKDAEQMVEWANATDYGLSASVWGDPHAGEALAARLEAGCVFVNQGVKSDPRLPFGGVKDSGYGRELGGRGVRQFANEKTVWVA